MVLERRFIYEIKRLGKVASVHSIRSLLVFDNSNIPNQICYLGLGQGGHVYVFCAGGVI